MHGEGTQYTRYGGVGYCLFLIILSMLDHEQSIMFGEVLRASKKTLMGAHRLSLGVRIFMLVTPRVLRGVHTCIFSTRATDFAKKRDCS